MKLNVLIARLPGTVEVSAALLIASAVSAQNIFVANWYAPGAIYEITPEGSQHTFHSGGLGEPLGLAFDTSGNLFVADSLGDQIDKFTGRRKSTFASVDHPVWLAFDNSGILFVSSANGSIYEISSDGSVSTFTTGLNAPTGIAFDKAGDLFANNWGAGVIDEYQNNDGALSSTATVFATGLSGANGLAFDAAGNLYSAENSTGTGDILKFAPGGTRSVFASHLGGYGELAFDRAGNLFMSNGTNLLKITTDGSVTSFAENLGNATGVAIQGIVLYTPEHATWEWVVWWVIALLLLLIIFGAAVLLSRPKKSQDSLPQS